MKFNSRARARVSGPGGACAGLVGVAVPLSGLMSSSLLLLLFFYFVGGELGVFSERVLSGDGKNLEDEQCGKFLPLTTVRS
jgi:hypothetical protein